MARIVEFEGRRIEVPDDATDDEVAEILSAQPASAPAQTAPAEATTAAAPAPAGATSSSWMDAIWGGAKKGMALADMAVRGVAEGVINLGTLPIEAAALRDRGVEYLADAVGVPESVKRAVSAGYGSIGKAKPYVGAEALKGYLDAGNNAVADTLGVERPRTEPADFSERLVNRVGQEVGAMAVPGGAALRVAEKVGVEGAQALPRIARHFVEPAARAPGKFVAKEATAAAAAGTGGAAASAAAENAGVEKGTLGHAAADFAGALGGLGASSISGAIAKPLGNVVGAVTGNPKFADKVIRDDVVDTIMRQSGEPNVKGADTAGMVKQIDEGKRFEEAIPGYKETLADRTQNPGLAAAEYSRTGGPNSGQYAQRRADNTAAVDAAVDRSAPKGEPGALRAELELERGRRLTDAGTHRANANDALEQHLQRIQPTNTAEGRGADIRAALEGASERTRRAVEEAWAPINGSTQRVDPAPLSQSFRQQDEALSIAESERFRPREADIPARLAGEGAEPIETGLLDEFGRPLTRQPQAAEDVPLNEITGIRSALTDAAREAGTAGRTNEARVLGEYIDRLDTYMEGAVPEALRGQYDTARAATRDMHDRFTRPQSAIAQTLDRQEGRYRAPDNAVAGKFVQSDEGNIEAFRSLMREAGSDARVVPAVRDQILSDVRSRRLLENPAELDRYLQRYNTILSDQRFANVRQELTTAGGLRRALDEATGAETQLTRELGDGQRPGTSTVGKYLQYGDERAEQAMSGVMRAHDPAKAADELLSFVGDDAKAVEGARKAFWNLMQKSARSAGETTQSTTGVQPWLPGKMKKFLDENDGVASRLYRDNPEHLENLRKIADTLQGANVGARGKAPNSSGTGQIQQSILPSPETLGSRLFAIERGVVGIPFTVLSLGSMMARRATSKQQAAAFNAALDRAMLDPDWAAQLLKENNPANRAALAKSAKLYLGEHAATFTQAMNEPEEDPTTKAIMRGGK